MKRCISVPTSLTNQLLGDCGNISCAINHLHKHLVDDLIEEAEKSRYMGHLLRGGSRHDNTTLILVYTGSVAVVMPRDMGSRWTICASFDFIAISIIVIKTTN